jgi:hypothetical protein
MDYDEKLVQIAKDKAQEYDSHTVTGFFESEI